MPAFLFNFHFHCYCKPLLNISSIQSWYKSLEKYYDTAFPSTFLGLTSQNLHLFIKYYFGKILKLEIWKE